MPVKNFRLVKYKKKYFLSIAFFTTLSTFFIIVLQTPLRSFGLKIYYWVNPYQGVYCHYIKSTEALPDISDYNPKPGRSIFFHETSCNSDLSGKIVITSRQACAVESAARLNREYDVYLLYASPGKFVDENTENDNLLKVLSEYDNVHILHIDLEKYFKKTPVEKLFKEGRMEYSQYAQSHTSDVLRYLTLWKYGGIYLDLDVLVTKNLGDLGSDFAGVESKTAVAAGILGFNNTGKGHEHVSACLDDLRDNFSGYNWGYNGPGTITRLVKKLCKESEVSKITDKTCDGFRIYPPSEFYSVAWEHWRWYFEPDFIDYVRQLTKKSHLIHVWNKLSITEKIPLNKKNIPYLEFAKEFCPKVANVCEIYF